MPQLKEIDPEKACTREGKEHLPKIYGELM